MKKYGIVSTKPDGGVMVTIPTREFVAKHGLDEALALTKTRMASKNVAEPTICDLQKDVPSDRLYRSAWSLRGGKVQVDMAKACEVQMQRIRKARNRKLAELDASHLRAMGQQDQAEMQKIEAEKQALRDIPQTMDLTTAKKPDQLRKMWPPQVPKPAKYE